MAPTVKEGAVRVLPRAQATFESEPHAPEYSCIPVLVKFALEAGAVGALNEIVWLTEAATKLYHTSYPGVPQPDGAGTPVESVEPITLPCVFVHVAPGVKAIAPPQSSLAGAGSVTQIVKVPFVVGTAFDAYNLI